MGEFIASKNKRRKDLKSSLHDNVYVTEGKEIENMLSPTAIYEVVKSYEKNQENEKLKSALEETTKTKSHNTGRQIEKPHLLGKEHRRIYR